MFDINSLLIESSFDTDQEIVSEWTVDSKEKEKIIKNALKKLSSAVNKNKEVSRYCRICTESTLDKYNTTIFNKLMKKNMYQSKLKSIFLGEYDFGNTLMVDGYEDIKQIVSDINEDLPDGVKLILGDTLDKYGNYLSIREAGMFVLKIKKAAIKESGIEFANSIMESLFG